MRPIVEPFSIRPHRRERVRNVGESVLAMVVIAVVIAFALWFVNPMRANLDAGFAKIMDVR
jgi:hypothetical protein